MAKFILIREQTFCWTAVSSFILFWFGFGFCPTVTISVYLTLDYMSLGVSIMTYISRPQHRAAKKVILQDSNSGLFDRELVALPLDQRPILST